VVDTNDEDGGGILGRGRKNNLLASTLYGAHLYRW
jgi:hypothetical protein